MVGSGECCFETVSSVKEASSLTARILYSVLPKVEESSMSGISDRKRRGPLAHAASGLASPGVACPAVSYLCPAMLSCQCNTKIQCIVAPIAEDRIRPPEAAETRCRSRVSLASLPRRPLFLLPRVPQSTGGRDRQKKRSQWKNFASCDVKQHCGTERIKGAAEKSLRWDY